MFNLFIDYNKWHYTYALLNIFRLTKEFVRFFLNLFSIKLFLKSLLLPVFSIPVNDVETETFTDIFAVFLGGIVLRIVGAIFRIFFIFLGILFSLVTIIFFSVLFVLWIFMPLIVMILTSYFVWLILITI